MYKTTAKIKADGIISDINSSQIQVLVEKVQVPNKILSINLENLECFSKYPDLVIPACSPRIMHWSWQNVAVL